MTVEDVTSLGVTGVETFPSAWWFEQMVADVRERPEFYRHLGVADFRLVVKALDGGRARSFGLVLDGYDVLFAGELADIDGFGPDATVEGDVGIWRDMVGNIVRNGRADGTHTLNSLTIDEAPLRVTAADPVGRDKFYRYAETLQTLFDSLGSHAPAR